MPKPDVVPVFDLRTRTDHWKCATCGEMQGPQLARCIFEEFKNAKTKKSELRVSFWECHTHDPEWPACDWGNCNDPARHFRWSKKKALWLYVCEDHKSDTLFLGDMRVRHFERMNPEEDVWGGEVVILGTRFHFEAIRVKEDVNGVQEGTKDPYDRLGATYVVYENKKQTVKIPGLKGDFVVIIHPHGD